MLWAGNYTTNTLVTRLTRFKARNCQPKPNRSFKAWLISPVKSIVWGLGKQEKDGRETCSSSPKGTKEKKWLQKLVTETLSFLMFLFICNMCEWSLQIPAFLPAPVITPTLVFLLSFGGKLNTFPNYTLRCSRCSVTSNAVFTKQAPVSPVKMTCSTNNMTSAALVTSFGLSVCISQTLAERPNTVTVINF